MAGNLIMQEKGWLGYKEQIIHSGEGPIWAIEWRGDLIAWANDLVGLFDGGVSGEAEQPGSQDIRYNHATKDRIYRPWSQCSSRRTIQVLSQMEG
jgi:hypothetical protein